MPKAKITESLIHNSQAPIELYDTVTSGLILRITSNGTKSFCYRYTTNGKKRRFTFGRYPNISISQARIEVQKFQNQLLIGKDPQAQKDKKKDSLTTFEELANEFKKKHFISLRESTQSKYRRIIDFGLSIVTGFI